MNNKGLIMFLFFISFISLAVVTTGGYYVYTKLDSIDNQQSKTQEVNNKIYKNPTDKDKNIGFIKESEEMIVNLNSAKNKKSYLKIKINFELKSESEEGLFDNYQAIIFDSILSIASAKTKEELMSLGGKEDLKEEIKNNINSRLPENIIKEVYFRTFVIQ